MRKGICQWVAWYTGQREFTSKDTAWADLPDDGVLGMALFETTAKPDGNCTRRHMSGSDWYFRWEGPDGVIYGENDSAAEDNAGRYPGAVFKRGKWGTEAEMHTVVVRMASLNVRWRRGMTEA